MASRYPFEYFCGANVVIYLDDFPLLECSGFSFQISESKRPVYGYASRLYDGIARGQVLVQGQLLVNYVHQDYLFRAAQLANGQLRPDVVTQTAPLTVGGSSDPDRILAGVDISESEIQTLTNRNWGAQEGGFESSLVSNSLGSIGIHDTFNLHDATGTFSVKALFGDQGGNRPAGKTGFFLSGVSFIGRGQMIQVDAETIVESYSFIARNVYSVKAPSAVSVTQDSLGNLNYDVYRNN